MASNSSWQLIAAAATHAATRSGSQAAAICGDLRGTALSWRAKHRKLQGLPRARALGAGDLYAFGEHDLLVASAAIIAEVFVYGHVRFLAPIRSIVERDSVSSKCR